MLNRGHFDSLELDAVLRGRQDTIVDAYHLNTCRTCREALLDLTLLAGLARGAPFDDPLEPGASGDDGNMDGTGPAVDRTGGGTLDVESVFAQFAALEVAGRESREPATGQPFPGVLSEETDHLLATDMQALLAAAFAADAQEPRFLDHLRHLRACGTCLGRFLRVSSRDMPSPRLVRRIARAFQPAPKPGPEAE